MPQIAVIIPCYNESKRLNVDHITGFLSQHPDVRMIFVNDGSTDNTKEILVSIQRSIPDRVFLMDIPRRKGKAEAVRAGLLEALRYKEAGYLGFMDADLAVSPEEFYRLYQNLSLSDNKFIFGCRIKKLGSVIKRNGLRHFFGRVITTLIVWITRIDAYDTQCSAKIFNREVVPCFTTTAFRTKWLFDVEIICRMRKLWGDLRMLGHEEPLLTWVDVKGSKLKWMNMFTIARELVVLFIHYRRSGQADSEN